MLFNVPNVPEIPSPGTLSSDGRNLSGKTNGGCLEGEIYSLPSDILGLLTAARASNLQIVIYFEVNHNYAGVQIRPAEKK